MLTWCRLSWSTLCTAASLNAIQPSSAHFTRAGYFDTPAKAMPSPSTSSSPSMVPRLVTIAVNSPRVAITSVSGRPMARSVSTDVDAWEIEQPIAS